MADTPGDAPVRERLADQLRDAFERFEREEQLFRDEVFAGAERAVRERADAVLGELRSEAAHLGVRLSAELDAARGSLRSAAAEEVAAARRELEAGAAARIDAAVEDLYARCDERLESELARLRGDAEETLGKIETAERRVRDQIERTGEKLSARARRQELKLVKRENSKRIERALRQLEDQSGVAMATLQSHVENLELQLADRLEQRETALRRQLETRGDQLVGELVERRTGLVRELETAAVPVRDEFLGIKRDAEERVRAALVRSEEVEQRAASASERVGQGMAQVEQALGGIAEAERRILEIEGRLFGVEGRVAEHASMVHRAVDVEQRLRAATAIEEEVARRIKAAEDRIRGMVDPGSAPNGG